MKSLLVVTVLVCLAFANATEVDLAQELVRSLSKYTRAEEAGQQTILPVEGEQKPKLTPKIFKEMVGRWSESSSRLLESLEKLRPKFYRILQGRLEYKDINNEMETMMMAGDGLFQTILRENLEATIELVSNSEGFEDPGSCNSMHELSKDFDVKSDPREAQLKNIEATVVDLECMARDMDEEIAALRDHCLKDRDITINDALRLLNGVTRYLNRAAVDGMRFAVAGQRIKNVWTQAYPVPPQQSQPGQTEPQKKELNSLLQKFLRTLEHEKP